MTSFFDIVTIPSCTSVVFRTYFWYLHPSQYIREDAAQEKKSYADKFGSKVSLNVLLFYNDKISHSYFINLQGAKGAKTAKAAKKASAGSGGDDIYIDTEENADGKGPEAKGSGRGAKSGAKVAQAWSKEEDYF